MKKRTEDLVGFVRCQILGHDFKVDVHEDKKGGGRVYVQLSYSAPDSKHGGDCQEWKGRKWYLFESMTDDEIVKTVWCAFEAAIKHEVMEGFTYDGNMVFNPHTPFSELIKASKVEVARTPKETVIPSGPLRGLRAGEKVFDMNIAEWGTVAEIDEFHISCRFGPTNEQPRIYDTGGSTSTSEHRALYWLPNDWQKLLDIQALSRTDTLSRRVRFEIGDEVIDTDNIHWGIGVVRAWPGVPSHVYPVRVVFSDRPVEHYTDNGLFHPGSAKVRLRKLIK